MLHAKVEMHHKTHLWTTVVVAGARPPDEYETDLGDDFSDREDEDIAPVTVSRSGRPIRANFHLEFLGTLIVDVFHVSQKKRYFVCYISNSLIIHMVISQSECPILVRCMYLDTQ